MVTLVSLLFFYTTNFEYSILFSKLKPKNYFLPLSVMRVKNKHFFNFFNYLLCVWRILALLNLLTFVCISF